MDSTVKERDLLGMTANDRVTMQFSFLAGFLPKNKPKRRAKIWQNSIHDLKTAIDTWRSLPGALDLSLGTLHRINIHGHSSWEFDSDAIVDFWKKLKNYSFDSKVTEAWELQVAFQPGTFKKSFTVSLIMYEHECNVNLPVQIDVNIVGERAPAVKVFEDIKTAFSGGGRPKIEIVVPYETGLLTAGYRSGKKKIRRTPWVSKIGTSSLNIPHLVYAQLSHEKQAITNKIDRMLDLIINKILDELTEDLEKSLDLIRAVVKVIPLEQTEHRIEIQLNSFAILMGANKPLDVGVLEDLNTDFEDLLSAPNPRDELTKILKKYIKTNRSKILFFSNLIHQVSDGNDKELDKIFGTLSWPKVGPGHLATWLGDETTYCSTDHEEQHEEYQFRKELLIAFDSYVKKIPHKLTLPSTNPGSASANANANASQSRDERASLYMLADLFSQFCNTSFQHLFHAPGMSFGSLKPNSNSDERAYETDTVNHMPPIQRNRHIVSEISRTMSRMVAYPLSGTLGIALNGVWEISPNNIALSDAASRSISAMIGSLIESAMNGMANNFHLHVTYPREAEDAVLCYDFSPPFPIEAKKDKLSICVTSAYANIDLDGFTDQQANIRDLLRDLSKIEPKNPNDDDITPIENDDDITPIENDDDITPIEIVYNILGGVAKDVVAYLMTVHGDFTNVQAHTGIDNLEYKPGEVSARTKGLPPVVFALQANGKISMVSRPKKEEYKPVGEETVWLYKYDISYLTEPELPYLTLFSTSGSVLKLNSEGNIPPTKEE